MATARNSVNNRLKRDRDPQARGGFDPRFDKNPSDTAKQNYTAITYGNDHGSIGFGVIHKQGDVTSSIILQTPDAEHAFFLDKDGERKGWTSSISPGNFQVECGSANEEAQDSLMLNAKNGNIIIKANNGKIRLEGTDIEIIATGEGGSKGNIQMTATETIFADSKKFIVDATVSYSIVSPGTGEIIANSVLKMYGSIIRGVSDACSVKNSKVGGRDYVFKNTKA